MGCKEIYSCNTCGQEYQDRMKAYNELLGLNFSGTRKFKLSDINATRGYHVCIWCAAQIVQQAPDLLRGKVVFGTNQPPEGKE